MKFSILALAAGVSLSVAQNLSGEPACATSCLLSAISAASCAPSDVACQCALPTSAVATCLLGACNPSDLQVAFTVGTNLCKAFSATATGLNSTFSVTATGLNSTVSTKYSNTTTATTVRATSGKATTTVTAGTTKFTSTQATGTGTTPPASTSSGAANGLVAGIGGAIGVLALVAAL